MSRRSLFLPRLATPGMSSMLLESQKKGLKKAPKKARGKLVNELFASLFLLSSKKVLLDTSSYFTVSFLGEISLRAMRNADVTTFAIPYKTKTHLFYKAEKKDLKGVTKENWLIHKKDLMSQPKRECFSTKEIISAFFRHDKGLLTKQCNQSCDYLRELFHIIKPNYLKKQRFSSSFLITWSKYTGPKWPWSTGHAF